MMRYIRSLLPLLIFVCFAFSGKKTGLMELLNQPVKSNLVQDFIKANGEYRESRFDDSYYYVFKDKGFDLMMSLGDTVEVVFVFADEADKHAGYKDSLPFGLNVAMNRREVEKILGKPAMTGGQWCNSFLRGLGQRNYCYL